MLTVLGHLSKWRPFTFLGHKEVNTSAAAAQGYMDVTLKTSWLLALHTTATLTLEVTISISPLLLSAFVAVCVFGLLYSPTMEKRRERQREKGKGNRRLKFISQRQRLQSEDLNYQKRVVSNLLTTADKSMGAGKQETRNKNYVTQRSQVTVGFLLGLVFGLVLFSSLWSWCNKYLI